MRPDAGFRRAARRGVRGRARPHQSASTSSRKRSPRCSKSRNWSKLAQAGESRTTSPGRDSPCARRTAVVEIAAAHVRDVGARQGASAISSAVSPIRYTRTTSLLVRDARELRERRPLAAPADDHPEAARAVGAKRPLGRLGVRRLRVVDEAHAVDLADGLEPVGDAGERAQRLRDRLLGNARGTRRSRGRGASSPCCAHRG